MPFFVPGHRGHSFYAYSEPTQGLWEFRALNTLKKIKRTDFYLYYNVQRDHDVLVVAN